MDNFSRDIDLEKQIEAYINGQLSEKEIKALWVDLLKKPEYIDLLETELGAREIHRRKKNAEQNQSNHIRGGDGGTVSEPSGSYYKWWAAAAAVAVIFIVISLLQIDTGQTVREMALTNINIAEHLASADVLRGQEDQLSQVDSLLNAGFKAALSGDAEQALRIYKKVTVDYKEASTAVSRAFLNIGILRFNSEEYRASSNAFNQALQHVTEKDSVLEEKAHWYLGNSYIHLDSIDKAQVALQKVYAMDGIYKKQAKRLLDKIED